MHGEDAVPRALRASAATLIGLAAHELNNRFAVMRETVGLLEDLSSARKPAAGAAARAHGLLDDQVGRALNVVRSLSGLGDALRPARDGFDTGAVVGDLLVLVERWAQQRSLRLERAIEADLPRAAGDPALFLCLVHRLLAVCVELVPPGGNLRVQVGRSGERIWVKLLPGGTHGKAAGAVPAPEDSSVDAELVRRLGGGLLFEGGGVSLLLLAAAR